MRCDEAAEQLEALLRVEIDDLDAERAQPVDAALEGARLADDDLAEAELAHEAAAVPARRERRDHDEVAIAALAARAAEGVGLAVDGGVVLLHAAIVTAADECAVGAEDGCADGNAALGETGAGLLDRDR